MSTYLSRIVLKAGCMHYMTVGELAQQVGISKVAIRYYERCGLIPKVVRANSGYRLYPDTVVGRIQFIINAKSVGFTLEEIKELLALQTHPQGTSQQVKSHTLTKLQIIQAKIVSLQKMADTLTHWVALCDGNVPLQDCPILEALYNPNAVSPVTASSHPAKSPLHPTRLKKPCPVTV